MSWYAFDSGKSLGERGSESGTIIRDEEYERGARITLEHACPSAPFTITCGVYGWMCHTRFFGTESEAQSEFESMKSELSRIVSIIPLVTDLEVDSKSRTVCDFISEFVKRFP
jgi:hypothetical protein